MDNQTIDNHTKTNRIHPLMAAAAVSVMLVSLVGVAALTGVLPNSHSTVAPVASTPPASVPATASLAAAPGNVAPALAESGTREPVPAAAPSAAEAPVAHKAPAAKPVHRTTTTRAGSQHASTPATVASAQPVCSNCGVVESVHAVQQAAKPSGLGVVAGAVLGGVLGNQVGNGNGRTLATVAGAVGGGYAGNEVEKRSRTSTGYEVRVRMEDGSLRTFTPAGQPGWRAGDRVRIVNGELTSRG